MKTKKQRLPRKLKKSLPKAILNYLNKVHFSKITDQAFYDLLAYGETTIKLPNP